MSKMHNHHHNCQRSLRIVELFCFLGLVSYTNGLETSSTTTHSSTSSAQNNEISSAPNWQPSKNTSNSSASATSSWAESGYQGKWANEEMGGFYSGEGGDDTATMKLTGAGILSHLDYFAPDYDNTVYPTFGTGNATVVNVSMYIRNIWDISDTQSSYSMEVFLSLSWWDDRLLLPAGTFLQVHNETLQQLVWLPPVFFGNARVAKMPKAVLNNNMLMMLSNGNSTNLVYQARYLLTLSCQMNLVNYPFDSQSCTLEVSVFGYYVNEVILQWGVSQYLTNTSATSIWDSVTYNTDIKFLQFTPTGINLTMLANSASGAAGWSGYCTQWRPCALMTMNVHRMYSFFLMDTFVPSALIVGLSWLAFWIDPDAVPARITLCVTTYLTLQTASTNSRNRLPAVSYVKALDIWLMFCQGDIFVGLIQFILIHFIKRTYNKPPPPIGLTQKIGDDNAYLPEQAWAIQETYRNKREKCKKICALIDDVSRIMFPLTFVLFAVAYFVYYLSQ